MIIHSADLRCVGALYAISTPETSADGLPTVNQYHLVFLHPSYVARPYHQADSVASMIALPFNYVTGQADAGRSLRAGCDAYQPQTTDRIWCGRKRCRKDVAFPWFALSLGNRSVTINQDMVFG